MYKTKAASLKDYKDPIERGDKSFACPYCGWTAASRAAIEKHYSNCGPVKYRDQTAATAKHKNLDNFCRFCQQGFSTGDELLAHKTIMHPQCALCGMTISSLNYVGRHYMQHEKMILKPCFWCKKKHETLVELILHFQEEHQPCQLCGAKISSSYTASKHLQAKHGDHSEPVVLHSNYPCKQCNKEYNTLVNLINHFIAEHNPNANKRRRAPIHNTNSNSSMARRHYAAGGWEPVAVPGGYACPRCGWVSCSDYMVKAHFNKSHRSEMISHKVTQCNICKEEFDQIDEFMQHRKFHPICKVCRQVMIDAITLHEHLDEKHPVCCICGKLLDNFLKMNAHSASHAEAKCFRCGDTFSSMTRLKCHFDSDHPEKTCHLCDTTHTNEETLYEHLAQGHYVNPNTQLRIYTAAKSTKKSSTISASFEIVPTSLDDSLFVDLMNQDSNQEFLEQFGKAQSTEPESKKAKLDSGVQKNNSENETTALKKAEDEEDEEEEDDEEEGSEDEEESDSESEEETPTKSDKSEGADNSDTLEKVNNRSILKVPQIHWHMNRDNYEVFRQSSQDVTHTQEENAASDAEDKTQTTCDLCGISFLRPGILQAHKRMVHSQGASVESTSV